MTTDSAIDRILDMAAAITPDSNLQPVTVLDLSHALHTLTGSLEKDLDTLNGLNKFNVAGNFLVKANLNDRVDFKVINVVVYCYQILIKQGYTNEEIFELFEERVTELSQLASVCVA